jgi:SSS family solute:Na+ symporter
MTILATQLGGGAIIGAADAAYQHGWIALAYSGGIALGLALLALKFGSRFREMGINTVPELFEKHYHSKGLKTFSALLYILSMFGILVAITVSARKFALSLGVSPVLFTCFWVTMIAYTSGGGFTTVVKTDVLQIIFILFTFLIVFIYASNSDIIHVTKPFISRGGDVSLVSWFVTPCLFAIIGQDMMQRCASAESPKVISKAALWAAGLLVVAASLPVYLGVVANQIGLESTGSSMLMDLIKDATSPSFSSFFGCAVLLAILTTADSLLNSISLNVVVDFALLKRINKSDKSVGVSRIVTLVVGVLALGLSFFVDEVIPTILTAYEISVAALSVPIIMALLKKSPSKRAAIASSLAGVGIYLVLTLISFTFKTELAVLFSLVAFVMVSRMRLRSKTA